MSEWAWCTAQCSGALQRQLEQDVHERAMSERAREGGLGPDQIHVLHHRNSRSRVTAETTQFTPVFTSVTRQFLAVSQFCRAFLAFQCLLSVPGSG